MATKLPDEVKVKAAKGFFGKALGLMFKRKVDYVLLMEFRNTSKNINLHSFFVFFKFHCIFLDEDKNIVDIEKDVPPFTMGISTEKRAKYVLEIPEGIIDIDEFSIGGRLILPDDR
ncbi:MAG: DUF192 domain-containing protein [Candidatus Thermoplasmatota archaeon]